MKHPNPNTIPYLGMIMLFVCSLLLMFHTFSYDGKTSQIQIGSKLWSDFGAHIPLIRSFSYGENSTRLLTFQPVESPLFPGEPIRYHFGFYALVGMVEKIGVRIDWALNTLSAVGFFGLLISIYYLSVFLFKRRIVGMLSVLFFLFNGSLSFLSFFKDHPLSLKTPIDIVTNSTFPSFGPWDNGLITAFWTLNIYTNQRHLGLSYALLIGALILLSSSPHSPIRRGFLVSAMIALLLCINFAAAGIAVIFLAWIFLSQKHLRVTLLPTVGIGMIVYAWLSRISHVSSDIVFQPGYLISGSVTVESFIRFWFANLGLHSVLIPIGILLSPKSVRRFIVPPLLCIFIIPNIYRFSPDMINNHKFFNFFLILGNMFSAYAIIRMITWCNRMSIKKLRTLLVCLVGGVSIISVTLSGIIDFFPIINDTKGNIADVRINPDSRFFNSHTNPNDIVANSTWFYHPASIAGRAVFSGYTYFTWSYGYDQTQREAALVHIYSAPTITTLCEALSRNNIRWVELNVAPESYVQPNWDLWNHLPFAYQNSNTKLTVYDAHQICDYK